MIPFSVPTDLKDNPLFIAAQKIILKLQNHQHVAYFVGGAVRDMILGVKITEIDIATSARPQDIMNLFSNHKSVGAHFGVILVTVGNFTFDVASFRKDGEYKDGRRPSCILFTDAQHDAQRRDFTINGLFYDPISKQIIDYVGGLQDLEQKIINTIGNPQERFHEDKLRMLRCIRFSAQLKFGNFQISEYILKVITQQANTLEMVSKERIREEMIKIINFSQDTKEIILLFKTGLAKNIFPIETVSDNSLLLFQNLVSLINFPFCLKYLALISENLHSPSIFQKLKQIFMFTTQEKELLENTLPWLDVPKQWNNLEHYQKKRILRTPHIQDILIFIENWTKIFVPQYSDITKSIVHYYKQEKNSLYPTKYVTGSILKEKGLTPSPQFKTILDQIENEQLQGNIQSQAQALSYLDDILRNEKQ